ncbi:RHS repeat-associated core domain-containing protein [Edaphocola aurantiacus]|uniref:RHS repeat-associated core domain-containing protein n=1 Tax=Edaphocola aurantiacus TaxID=2601682 RepID=UPI001C954B52|nr:RHS repeat-associated core domain-containing protein [Edaphocola aurantiacus]
MVDICDENKDRYRFGFNGQEKDNELKGVGNSINYKARMQDTRVAKFLSLDPLSQKFPMLTPYQFASNNPILNVDLDGLEGVSYRVVKLMPNGFKLPTQRVIETDVYVAVNNNGANGAYTPADYDKLQFAMTRKYNENITFDEAGLPIKFVFNFKTYDPEILKQQNPSSKDVNKDFADKIATETSTLSNFSFKGSKSPMRTYKGVVLWNDNSLPLDQRGNSIGNQNTVNPLRGQYQFGRAENHEMTHFFLQMAGASNESPDTTTNKDHDFGGWMTPNDDNPATNRLAPGAVNKIVESVPRIDDQIIPPVQTGG